MRSNFLNAAGKMLTTLIAAAEASAAAAAAIATATAAITNDNINKNNNINNNNSSNYSYNNNNQNNNNSTFIVTLDEYSTTSLASLTSLMSSTVNQVANVVKTGVAMTTTTATTLLATKYYETNENNILMTTNGEIDDASINYVPPSQRPETYIVAVLFTLIFIVGVLGNGTLVIIFFRHRSMRNIPNTYILSLALADLLVIIVCVPMATIVYTQESWTFGVDLCRISEFFKDISIGVSVFTLTALSGERYCAIVNPLRKLQTKPLTVFTASMIWLLAILLGTPSFVVSDINEIHINAKNFSIWVCTPFGKNGTHTETYAKYTVISKACIYYLLPLSIIGALYILMAKRLHMSARDMPGEALGMQSRSQARARRHVARMVVAFVVVFFACFFPYHVFELWFHLNPNAIDDFDEFWHALRIIGFCTSFLHSCVNPVTLYIISGVFRQHFNRYLCCLCVKKPPRLRQHSTATAMMDTSIVSIRRSNTATNYNRASLYVNNAALAAGTAGGGGGAGVGGGGVGSNTNSNVSFHRQPSLHLQRGSICANNNSFSADVVAHGNGNNSVNKGGVGGISSPAQSIILSDKR